MRILFEVLERDRFEIVDPCIPAAAETEKIISASENFDCVRILKFDPATLETFDLTPELLTEFRGSMDETAPLWVRLQPQFRTFAAEERRDAREWATHVASFSRAA